MARGMQIICCLMAGWLVLGWVQPAAAQSPKGPAFLSISGGYFDINDDKDAAEIKAELRTAYQWSVFKPFYGLMATSDRAVYGYGGVLVDLFFGRRWVLTPSFAAGIYRDGDGKDLGHTIEFRSSLEFAYRFNNRARIGLQFYHLSNASLSDNNPGTEVLSVVYSHPLR